MSADIASSPRQLLLARLYEAFNRQDFDDVIGQLTDDVAWPNMIERTVLRGHDQVRAYWEDQLTWSTPNVVPVGFIEQGDEIVVMVDQRIERDGQVARSTVAHRYRFKGDLVAAMTVESVDDHDFGR
jgi:ketosteroid isomerase-like protein